MVYVTQKYKFVLWRIKGKVLSLDVWRQRPQESQDLGLDAGGIMVLKRAGWT